MTGNPVPPAGSGVCRCSSWPWPISRPPAPRGLPLSPTLGGGRGSIMRVTAELLLSLRNRLPSLQPQKRGRRSGWAWADRAGSSGGGGEGLGSASGRPSDGGTWGGRTAGRGDRPGDSAGRGPRGWVATGQGVSAGRTAGRGDRPTWGPAGCGAGAGVAAGHGDSEGRTAPRGAGDPSPSRPPSSLPPAPCRALPAARLPGRGGVWDRRARPL